ncbi:MAG: hypothetical protein KIS94_05655 [Chitinophagales bacterium]|nr:hypothetical protein [Chitinophagales bacterium]
MSAVDDYKNTPRTWKPEPFNFRGNKANKAFVEEIKRAYKFESEGIALDYIMHTFRHTSSLTQSLTSEVSELKAQIQNLANKLKTSEQNLQLANNEIARLQDLLDESANKPEFVFPDTYSQLKEATEKTLPMLFQRPESTIPVTDLEFLALLVEYCERDPSKEFPFKPAAEKIIERYKVEYFGKNFVDAETAEASKSVTNQSV